MRTAALGLQAVAVLAGAATGLATVAIHRIVALHVPAGLLLGLAATFSAVVVLRQSRLRLVVGYSVGWLGVLGAAVAGRPEGDFAIAADVRGYLLLAAGFGVLVLGVLSAARRRPAGRGPPYTRGL